MDRITTFFAAHKSFECSRVKLLHFDLKMEVEHSENQDKVRGSQKKKERHNNKITSSTAPSSTSIIIFNSASSPLVQKSNVCEIFRQVHIHRGQPVFLHGNKVALRYPYQILGLFEMYTLYAMYRSPGISMKKCKTLRSIILGNC